MYQHLGNAETTISAAANVYAALQRTAEAAIQPWRQATTTDEQELRELARITMRNPMRARSSYESSLGSLAGRLAESGDWDRAEINGVNQGEGWVSQGLTFDGEYVWVTSTRDEGEGGSQVYVYSKDELDNAGDGEPVHAERVVHTPASS